MVAGAGGPLNRLARRARDGDDGRREHGKYRDALTCAHFAKQMSSDRRVLPQNPMVPILK
jgi:hypothetical protein